MTKLYDMPYQSVQCWDILELIYADITYHIKFNYLFLTIARNRKSIGLAHFITFYVDVDTYFINISTTDTYNPNGTSSDGGTETSQFYH